MDNLKISPLLGLLGMAPMKDSLYACNEIS
jgi:hypothetical protein